MKKYASKEPNGHIMAWYVMRDITYPCQLLLLTFIYSLLYYDENARCAKAQLSCSACPTVHSSLGTLIGTL